MATPAQSAVDHRHLRSAIEFAVAIADAGQRMRPPLAYPGELKPFLKQPRVPASALGTLRRAIEADDGFRRRLAAGALPELVDPIGIEWLQRADGWQDRISELVATADRDAERADQEAAWRKAERRREAAEQAAIRTRAELVAAHTQIEVLTRQVDEHRGTALSLSNDRAALADQLAEAKVAERHANDRAEAARARLASVESERDVLRQRMVDAEEQRDALLADRAERAGVPVGPQRVDELRDLARAARVLASRLAELVDVGPSTRQPVGLPGGASRDTVRATEHLLRVAGALVLIDGYNVAKLAWPDEVLEVQRTRGLDIVDDVVRRFGTDIAVVFDGATVVGAHTTARRLARVVYSPAGITADDVIRVEVAAAPAERPVVVVTNDQEVRRSVAGMGANLISSDAFLAVARR